MIPFDAAPDLTPAGRANVSHGHAATAPGERRSAAKPAAPAFEPFGIALGFNIDACEGGYVSQALDSLFHGTRLTVTEAIALKAITCSLSAQRARTADGRIVDTPQRALRWILDQIAEQMPPELIEELQQTAG